MKIEKKLVALSVFAFAIGMVLLLPLPAFMNATAQANIADSLFNIDIPCAYYNANVTYDVEINSLIDGSHRVHDVWYRDGAVIAVQPSINYDALDNNTIARVEFFEYTISTDKLQLQKSCSYFAFNKQSFGQTDEPKSSFDFIFDYYEKNLQPKRGGTFGGDSFGGLDVTDLAEPMDFLIVGNSMNCGYPGKLEKSHRNILDAIAETQTIYLDVKRVAYISLSNDGTVIVVEDNKLLQHLELTKTDDGFMFGNPTAVKRETYFGLPTIPYNGTDVPEEFLPLIWPDIFGK
jgi:hypothetical protein